MISACPRLVSILERALTVGGAGCGVLPGPPLANVGGPTTILQCTSGVWCTAPLQLANGGKLIKRAGLLAASTLSMTNGNKQKQNEEQKRAKKQSKKVNSLSNMDASTYQR